MMIRSRPRSMFSERFSLGVAVAASLAAHLLVMAAPGWQLASEEETEPIRLEGRLAPPPSAAQHINPAQPAPQTKAKPKRRAERRAEPVAVAAHDLPPAVETEPTAMPAPGASAGETAEPAAGGQAIAAAEAATAAPDAEPAPPVAGSIESTLPQQGQIRYDVTLGGKEFVAGSAFHTWQMDGSAYVLKSVTETVGLAALLRPVRITQVSEGAISDRGLVPSAYRSVRNDASEPAESAQFDWQQMRVVLTSKRRHQEASLVAGAQDMLSVIYQLAMMPAATGSAEYMIATGKSFNPYVFDLVSEEPVATRVGELRTVHFKTRAGAGEQTTEVWLALDYQNLPVRIRFTDRKGDSADMIAAEIQFAGVRLAEVAAPRSQLPFSH